MAKRRRSARSSPAMDALRRRLQEAEDTIKAIRDGHVEALVVHAPDGEQVYTLRSADQPYRLMVEQMREGALTLAADGTILYCNQRFAELTARPAERIAGHPFQQFLHPDDLPTLRRMLTAKSCRAEVQLQTATGSTNPAQLSSITLDIDGVRTVAVVVTDLTHERTERGLRESNRLKDEFLATLSHELRTPLNVILGWTRMLLNDQVGEDARRHALELIDRNAEAQAQLVNDLVDMSRMTTGKLQVVLEPLPVIPALDAALESVRPAAEAKHLSIHTSWRVDEATVLADPTRMQQILWNLLSNAIKFTPSGGEVWLKVGWTASGGQYMSVKDTGPGIPEEEIPVVLAKFGQGSNAIKSAEQGTGLGLPIAKNLVELHGGTFTLKSKIRIGTELTATFPPERVMAALPPLSEPGPPVQPQPDTEIETSSKSKRSLFKLRA
jgi:PAS domain S-box-containing protein